MFELFQVVWDLFMVRRAAKSGQLTLRKAAIAIGLTVLLYALVIPAFVLYDKHPEYKPLMIVGMVLGAADLIFLVCLGFYWQRQWLAAQKSEAGTGN
jgi:peptidoglycan/LPS O-acetylase OafA/YrhL